MAERLTDNRTIGIYSGGLGQGENTDLPAANDLPESTCWKDLLKPECKGHVQMAKPNSWAPPTLHWPRSCRSSARRKASSSEDRNKLLEEGSLVRVCVENTGPVLIPPD